MSRVEAEEEVKLDGAGAVSTPDGGEEGEEKTPMPPPQSGQLLAI